MDSPRTISFRMDDSKVKALDAIAATMQRDRSFLLNEAVDAYLEWSAGFERVIRAGMRDAKEGRWVDHQEVRNRLANREKKRKTA